MKSSKKVKKIKLDLDKANLTNMKQLYVIKKSFVIKIRSFKT